jgi:spermidine/putrescine transport system substrate-binding protein
MRISRLAMAAGLALAAAAGCGGRRPALHVYTWADYIKPELVSRFEREHDCRVVIDTFDSNEAMFAKLQPAPRATTCSCRRATW